MKSVSKSHLKAHLLRICRELEASGEELVVTDRDRPVLRIVPIKSRAPMRTVFADLVGKLELIEDPDQPTLEEWNAL
jgi:antitoxin (DNA-binding transcriptional repressor) of toxin-antitoxin stability system